jgi:hypothetical protein
MNGGLRGAEPALHNRNLNKGHEGKRVREWFVGTSPKPLLDSTLDCEFEIGSGTGIQP